MIDVAQITDLHRCMVQRWHCQPIDNPYQGFWAIVCDQFRFNFLLWHEEDVARSREVSDERIAQVKRAIDGYNQKRNDWMEKIDDGISDELARLGVTAAKDAPQNTETAGSVVDRLGILALRIYHLEEQADRRDVDGEHRQKVEQKLAICLEQHDDLSRSLAQLLADLSSGKKRHKTYRHLKMYNDPTLNPYLYKAQRRLAS